MKTFWNKDERCRGVYCRERGATCEPLTEVGPVTTDVSWKNTCSCVCFCRRSWVYVPARDACMAGPFPPAPTELVTEPGASSTSATSPDTSSATFSVWTSTWTMSSGSAVSTSHLPTSSSTVKAATKERIITGRHVATAGPAQKARGTGTAVAVGLTLGLLVLALILVLSILWWRRRRRCKHRSRSCKPAADVSSEYQCLSLPGGPQDEYASTTPQGSPLTTTNRKYVPAPRPPPVDPAEYNYIESKPDSQGGKKVAAQGDTAYLLPVEAQHPAVTTGKLPRASEKSSIRVEPGYREIYYGRSSVEGSASSDAAPQHDYRVVYYAGVPAMNGGPSPPGSPIYQAAENSPEKATSTEQVGSSMYQDLSSDTPVSPLYQALSDCESSSVARETR